MAQFLVRLRLILLLVLILMLAGLAFLWWNIPRLVSFTPADGSGAVPANANLQLTFSRPMQPAMVEEKLQIDPAVPGAFSWQGNILTFTPERPWQAGVIVRVQLTPGARASGASGAMRLVVLSTCASAFAVSILPMRRQYYLLDPLSGREPGIEQPAGRNQDFQSLDGSALCYSTALPKRRAIYRLELTEARRRRKVCRFHPAWRWVARRLPLASGLTKNDYLATSARRYLKQPN
jgi:hypothetical protein